MKKIKNLAELFWTMFKIGLFTFGGGYAMINVFDHEFVSNKKWISSDEFMDLVVIAESTPGPIAINCATYIGYKQAGVIGSVFSTLGMVLPSFSIICIISLFFNSFLSISWVSSAFRGIQACVIYLILSAGIKMLKKIKKTPFNIVALALTLLSMLTLSLLAVNFSSIFYILIFATLSLVVYLIGKIRGQRREGEK